METPTKAAESIDRLRSAPLILRQRCIACCGDAEIPPDTSLETDGT